MRATRRATSGRSVVETMIVIGIAGVVVSILMPAIGVMRENALSTRCQQHLRALGVAAEIYMSDYLHENWLAASEPPNGPWWFEKLAPHVAGHDTGRWRENFVCPRAPRAQRGFRREAISYGWNERYLPFRTLKSAVQTPDETILIADSLAGPTADTLLGATGPPRADFRHSGRANVLFVGGNWGAMTRAESQFEWPRYWDRE